MFWEVTSLLEFICSLFESIIGILTSVLPQSPFRDINISADVGNALGWLNWVFPVRDCLAIMSAWLVAVLAFVVARFVISKISFVGKMAK